jgi:hypothetical protein
MSRKPCALVRPPNVTQSQMAWFIVGLHRCASHDRFATGGCALQRSATKSPGSLAV